MPAMVDSVANPVALTLFRLADVLRAAVTWPGRVSIYIGATAMIFMAAITATDVVMRNLFSIVVPGGLEITGLMTILATLCAVAVVEIERSHIQVDLILRIMPEWVRHPTLAGGLMLSLMIISVTALQMLFQADYLQDNGIVTGVHEIPTWPFVAVGGLFVLLMGVALLSNLSESVGRVFEMRDGRALVVLAIWTALVAFITYACFRPEFLQNWLSRDVLAIFCIILCFVLIFLGVHVAASMAVTSLMGISLLIMPTASLTTLRTTAISVVSDQTWSVVPLFTWMGLIVVASGFAQELYKAAYRWIGHMPGGLASASTVACAGLSSIVGDTLSGVYSMGSIALPQMKSYGYDMKLATASIACAATIGVMIPPSLAFIVYGMVTEVSIGKLFIAGLLPGILFTVILISLITVRAMLNPSLAPRGEVSTWKERFEASRSTWPIILLMLMVLGGIYSGLVTPNEAAGLGVTGAIMIALFMRRLTVDAFWHSITQTLRLTSGIIIIFMFATVFSRFIAISGLTQQLAGLVVDLNLGKYQIVAAIVIFYLVIGMFMNALPALVLTVPLFFPIAMSAGFDPVWFGVLVVIMVELGVVTPPIGVIVFAISAIAKDVPMYDIFRGVLPFWLAYMMLAALIVLFPQIALFLPSLM